MILGILLLVLIAMGFVFYYKPPKVSVEGLPEGFVEKQFDTGKVSLNYIEGPNNGPPMLLIPGQTESWQGYKLVLPSLVQDHHVFAVDVRGHGKSTRTPGEYSYVQCGRDLRIFLKDLVGKPAVVSGFSSGGVIAAWLGANASECVSALVLEDPPLFASVRPRIMEEKHMLYTLKTAVEKLKGPPGKRDVAGYFFKMGIPAKRSDRLITTPPIAVKLLMRLLAAGKRMRPESPYDAPLLPFALRASFKFLHEYDVDFSAAAADGRLSQGFDPAETLAGIGCPVLLLHADWDRHPTWGIIGALDANDIKRIRELVGDLKYVPVDSRHEIHMREPDRYLEAVEHFLTTIG